MFSFPHCSTFNEFLIRVTGIWAYRTDSWVSHISELWDGHWRKVLSLLVLWGTVRHTDGSHTCHFKSEIPTSQRKKQVNQNRIEPKAMERYQVRAIRIWERWEWTKNSKFMGQTVKQWAETIKLCKPLSHCHLVIVIMKIWIVVTLKSSQYSCVTSCQPVY